MSYFSASIHILLPLIFSCATARLNHNNIIWGFAQIGFAFQTHTKLSATVWTDVLRVPIIKVSLSHYCSAAWPPETYNQCRFFDSFPEGATWMATVRSHVSTLASIPCEHATAICFGDRIWKSLSASQCRCFPGLDLHHRFARWSKWYEITEWVVAETSIARLIYIYLPQPRLKPDSDPQPDLQRDPKMAFWILKITVPFRPRVHDFEKFGLREGR